MHTARSEPIKCTICQKYLTRAILTDATLINVNITGVNWSNTHIGGITMRGVYMVTGGQVLQYTPEEINDLFCGYNCIR